MINKDIAITVKLSVFQFRIRSAYENYGLTYMVNILLFPRLFVWFYKGDVEKK
jgi:hypothetical protein